MKIALVVIIIICIITIVAIVAIGTAGPAATPTPTPTPTPSATPTSTPTPTPTPTPSPSSTPSPISSLELTVHFIDVGQGDAILIDLGETEVLIDGGDRSPGVTSYLLNHVEGSLEVMVATHPHADHIGGLIDVLDDFDVEEIWINGDISTSATYIDFITKVNAENASVYEARRGNTIIVDGLILNVLHPVEPLVDDINNNSIILKLSYGDIDFLFQGDAEAEAESSMIAAGIITDIDILKVGHHGSNSSSSQAFLDIAQPEVAIYMAGIDNSYGHPHTETITALETIGATIYGTDVCGTITITTDGTEYEVSECAPTLTPTPAVTPTPILTPTPTSTLGPTPTPTSGIQITCIFYDGLVYQTESDEYVEIKNLGTTSQDLLGWILIDMDEGYPSFTFPDYVLEASETIRVYTNEYHPEWGGFSFGYGQAIWNNEYPDYAVLYDAEWQEISRKSYPPGC